jgi:hypothetical protein
MTPDDIFNSAHECRSESVKESCNGVLVVLEQTELDGNNAYV